VDGWDMPDLHRDLTRIAAVFLGAATLIGATIGWVGHQLFEHLHDEGRSDHFRSR
jgi:hypothetical protein